jgi:carboxylate-amine ligase
VRTVGVEEEFLLVDDVGAPVGLAQEAAGGGVQLELKEEMLETGTDPCLTLGELDADVRKQRRVAAMAAASAGARLAALATSPLPVTSNVTAAFRYRRIAAEYGLTAREQLTCGCHVHVQVADDEEGVAVLDRIGPWLPVLLAMSANSPFWNGVDSGYASYRSQVWQRWPTAGPTGTFGSAAAYRQVIDDLVATGSALDRAMIYFDARLSERYPTLEIRVADVCLRAEDTVLIGALARALVETSAREAADGFPLPGVRPEVLRGAGWRAGRAGLRGPLVHPVRLRQVPAGEAVAALIDHVRPVLAETGEESTVSAAWQRLLNRGSGAEEQRFWAVDGVAAVVAGAVEATLA